MGTVDAMEAVPRLVGHPAKQRVSAEPAAVFPVALCRTCKLVDCLIEIHVRRGLNARVDCIVRANAVLKSVSQHLSCKKESLEPMTAQIEAVDGAVEAVGKMYADLPSRPSPNGPMPRRKVLNLRHDL